MNIKQFFWSKSIYIGIIAIIVYIVLLLVNVYGNTSSLFGINELYYHLIGLEFIPIVVFGVLLRYSLRRWRKIYNYKQEQKRINPSYKLSFFDVPKNLFIKALAYSMGTMWSLGWILYTCALWSNYKSDGNYAEILGYAAMSSLDLFMMDINGNLLDNINGDDTEIGPFPYPRILKGCIILVSIFSALCTFAILINFFFSRFISYIHSQIIRITQTENYHLFIFWGTGENERLLAKDIMSNPKYQDKKNLIIFIDTDHKESEETDGWTNVVTHLTLKNPLAPKLNNDSHAMYLISEHDICSIDTSKSDVHHFWSKIGLSRIDKLLEELAKNVPEKEEKNEIHFFFLSNNRDKNVLASRILIEMLNKDTRITTISKSIYCATRKDGVTSVIEEENVSNLNSLRVKVIDDANISVEILKRQEESYPAKFVDFDFKNNPGQATSEFCSLIIGFGETGRDIFRYLYEYSAIPSVSQSNLSRIPFECHIVDRNINNLKGRLISNSPSIFDRNYHHLSDKKYIKFHNLLDTSTEFYNLLDDIGYRLNYVVVCVGNDEANITIAVSVLKYIRKYNYKLKKSSFKIFVRTYEDESFSHLESIVEYYNNLYGYDIITIFGKKEQIYSYQYIVQDKIDELAEQYHNAYTETAYEYNMDKSKGPNWNTLKRMMNYDIYLDNTLKNKQEERPEAIFDVNRRINENKKNVFHLHHKIYVILQFINAVKEKDEYNDISLQKIYRTIIGFGRNAEERFEFIKNVVLNNATDTFEYKICNLVYNLCVFEHLRWNASHELIGFTTGKKEFKAKTHNCLKDWYNLDPYTPLYDYLVVETSLCIYLDMLESGEDMSL